MRSVSVGFKSPKQKDTEDSNQRRADNVANIYVKCKPGRRHYYEGRVIPTDKFIPVDGNDPMIRRAIDHWKDLEVEGEASPPTEGTDAPTRRSRARPDDPPLAPEHRQPPTPRE
jgi:hypothetical protein